MLLNSNQPSTAVNATQYFIRIANGQEVGPYATYEQARISATTMPIIEGVPPSIFPRVASNGSNVMLFG